MSDTVTFEVEIEKDVDFPKVPLIKQYIESQGLTVNLQQQSQNQNLESSQFTQQQINDPVIPNDMTFNYPDDFNWTGDWKDVVNLMKEMDKMVNYSPF